METQPKRKNKLPIIFSVIIIIIALFLIFNSLSKETTGDARDKALSYFENDWQEFNSTISHFKILFPSYPTHQGDQLDVPQIKSPMRYDSYVSADKEGNTYVVNTTIYPEEVDASIPENNLEGSLNGMLAASQDNELVFSEITEFNGYKALDYHLKNNTVNLKGRIILINQSLYQLMVVYEDETYDDELYNRFISSFNLTQ